MTDQTETTDDYPDALADQLTALLPYMTDDTITVAEAVELYRRDTETKP